MKRSHNILLIATIILILAILTGITLLIVSPKSAMDTTVEILAFTVSGSSVLLAIISQVTAYRERREAVKMIHDLNKIIAQGQADKTRDQNLNHKLDQLLKKEPQK